MSWHLGPTLLADYLDGGLAEAPAASVESHLMRCPECRGRLATAAGGANAEVHERTWQALAESVDEQPATWTERLLLRWLPPDVVRLLVAAPSMRRAWWTAGTGLLVLALVAAHLGSGAVGTALFLVTAPLLPLAGVALAYGAGDELAGEVARTTPYPRFRLLLLRTAAVAVSTLPVAGLLALALPVGLRPSTLWLAPAAALCTVTLALAARFDPRRAAAALTLLWLAGSSAALARPRPQLSVEELLERAVVFRPAGQAVLLAIAALAVAVAVTRRTTFEDRRRA